MRTRQNRRESVSALKNAKLAERKRSLKQQKVDEQERRREQLKRKIIESAEEAARAEVEAIKREAIAEALALKSQAKAKAKATKTDALRLRGSLLAAAKREAQQMREQVVREVAQLGTGICTSSGISNLQSDEFSQTQPSVPSYVLPASAEDAENLDESAREQQSGSDDDSAFESACDWEVLNEMSAKVDEEDGSWVIG